MPDLRRPLQSRRPDDVRPPHLPEGASRALLPRARRPERDADSSACTFASQCFRAWSSIKRSCALCKQELTPGSYSTVIVRPFLPSSRIFEAVELTLVVVVARSTARRHRPRRSPSPTRAAPPATSPSATSTRTASRTTSRSRRRHPICRSWTTRRWTRLPRSRRRHRSAARPTSSPRRSSTCAGASHSSFSGASPRDLR